jgi:hypothetical protein
MRMSWSQIQEEAKYVLTKSSAYFGVHVLQNNGSGLINTTVWPAATRDDSVMCCWKNVTVFMVTEPVETEVTGWFATANILVVIHKFHVSVSAKFVHDLQFSMYSRDDRISRCQARSHVASTRGKIKLDKCVKCFSAV